MNDNSNNDMCILLRFFFHFPRKSSGDKDESFVGAGGRDLAGHECGEIRRNSTPVASSDPSKAFADVDFDDEEDGSASQV